ncbi:hypothetical protein [Kitasatospora cineracea]|uniref:Uncharacterized protein n=1 Tax=Kitasatospora cineracea TaxID=88074 RepID=A0A3N4R413_9ACTN|nr:hypothetical protein [Kitasatospora cineracea]RPE27336.1 hypothetical protein EDD38_7481 [Kitasatospora cineracea]
MATAVYVLPSSPSWHTSTTCRALDTALLRTRSQPTPTTDPGGRPACLVCADTDHDDWTLTVQTLWELYELIGPSKPYTEWDEAAGRPVIAGLTIREHHGLPRLVARYGDTIRCRSGRYTVHPAADGQAAAR